MKNDHSRLTEGILLAFSQGDFDSVRKLASEAVESDPSFTFGWKALGAACAELASTEEAIHALTRAQELDPNDPETLNALGSSLMQAGRHQDAGSCLRAAIDRRSGFVEAHLNLGHLLMIDGDHAAAKQQFDIAIQSGGGSPLLPVLLKFSADTLLALKQPEKALERYGSALELAANFPEALVGRGDALQSLGRFDEALLSYDAAISLRSDIPEIFNNRGNTLKALKRFDEALASFDRALDIDSARADTWYNSALVLQELRRLEQAVERYDRSIALNAANAVAFNNRGVALQELGRLDESLASLDEAVRLRPDDADAHLNRGVTLGELLRHREAMSAFETSLSLKPGYADALWNKALIHLLHARYADGWRLYESRTKCKGLVALAVEDDTKRWSGSVNLLGKTVLLHSEQGLGDTIQFCRFVGRVSRLGAKVQLLIEEPLRRLFESSFESVRITTKGLPLPPFDLHCSLMSLPFALGATDVDLAVPAPYLRALPKDIARWRLTLDGPTKAPRVGLVWRGNPDNRNDRVRSVPLPTLLSHLPPGPRYVSLQKSPDDEERSHLAAAGIKDLSALLSDFADTAAACSALDLVISVDTSVAHLAGALGSPVWVLIPHVPDWRWLLNGSSSVWYPTMRLFRQGPERSWEPVLRSLATELREFSDHV